MESHATDTPDLVHKKASSVQKPMLGATVVVDDTEIGHKKTRCYSKWCRHGCLFWCRKYFWEGQTLRSDKVKTAAHQLPENASWGQRVMVKYRRPLGMLIPTIFVHIWYWSLAITHNFWPYFQRRWPLSIAMIFGGIVAGMTSEGGGAVAFPVLTLAFSEPTSVGRDVSILIQASGMSCASFAIFFMKVQVEVHSLIFCSIGGLVGIIFGLELVDPNLSPPTKKMAFVSIWFAFSFVLIILNRTPKRRTLDTILDFRPWKGVVLVLVGFVGGIFTSFAGGGLDICSFSFLTLLFRVSEKVATPTSVILMASNSIIGVFWRGAVRQAISQASWEYIAVTAPIVFIQAPIGSVIGTHFHRIVLAAVLIVIDTIALVSAYIILPLTPALIGMSVGIIVGGLGLFAALAYAGWKLMLSILANRTDIADHIIIDGDVIGQSDSEDDNDSVELEHNDAKFEENANLVIVGEKDEKNKNIKEGMTTSL